MIEDYDLSMKIIVLGNGTVGKTSLVQRFAKNYFKEEYKKTLGVDFLIKKIYVKQIDRECEFLIYDCAGQKEFDSVTSKYYKDAAGAIIAFSSVDRDSFASVETWRKKMALAGCDNIPVILAQNKVDLIDNDNPIIREKEINAIANKLNLKLFKISVKENLNITQVFEDLVIQHLKLDNHNINGKKDEIVEVKNTKSLTSLIVKKNKPMPEPVPVKTQTREASHAREDTEVSNGYSKKSKDAKVSCQVCYIM